MKFIQSKSDSVIIGAILIVMVIAIIITLIVYNNKPAEPETDLPASSQETTTPSGTTNTKPSESSNTVNEKPQESTESAPATTPEPTPAAAPTQTPSQPQSSTSHCYHYEAGRCWDDLENEMYSAGLYDREYGDYGTSLDYGANCDATCRDILEDAYDEGWYDQY